MPLKEKRKLYKCGADRFVALKDIPTWPVYAARPTPEKKSKPSSTTEKKSKSSAVDKTRCKW